MALVLHVPAVVPDDVGPAAEEVMHPGMARVRHEEATLERPELLRPVAPVPAFGGL